MTASSARREGWVGHEQVDVRSAIATCLLEHLLERHFEHVFPAVEKAVGREELLRDTLGRCFKLGRALDTPNARRMDDLLGDPGPGRTSGG